MEIRLILLSSIFLLIRKILQICGFPREIEDLCAIKMVYSDDILVDATRTIDNHIPFTDRSGHNSRYKGCKSIEAA